VRYSPASVLARLIAVSVDVLIGSCAIGIALMLATQRGLSVSQIQSLADDPAAIVRGMIAASVAAAALPFLFAMQVSKQGATPGKALMSLSVRSVATGRFPDYPHALGRETIRLFHVAPFVMLGEFSIFAIVVVVGVIYDMARSRLSQTWYDRALGTVIVAPVVERE
jgi:hypothetical protein